MTNHTTPPPTFIVLCEDGQRRHAEPFASQAEADTFAQWGHCCTVRHTIVRQPVECIVDFDHDGITLWDCPCAECRGLRLHDAWLNAE